MNNKHTKYIDKSHLVNTKCTTYIGNIHLVNNKHTMYIAKRHLVNKNHTKYLESHLVHNRCIKCVGNCHLVNSKHTNKSRGNSHQGIADSYTAQYPVIGIVQTAVYSVFNQKPSLFPSLGLCATTTVYSHVVMVIE